MPLCTAAMGSLADPVDVQQRPSKLTKADLKAQMESLVRAVANDPPLAVQRITAEPWLALERIPHFNGYGMQFEGEYVLAMACHGGLLELMRVLIDAGTPVNFQTRKHSWGAIHLLLSGHGESDAVYPCLELLLARGARVDGVDGSGVGVIYADPTISPECLELLLLAGARVNCYDGEGAHHAHHLMREGANQDPLTNAKLMALIDAGVDLGVGRPLSFAVQPLAIALSTQNYVLAERLLQKGCDLAETNHLGQTRLFIHENPATMAWVLDRAPELLDRRDLMGQTPLLYWLRHLEHNVQLSRFLGAIFLLIDRGSDLDAYDLQGPVACRTPRQILSGIKSGPIHHFWKSWCSLQAGLQAVKEMRGEMSTGNPFPLASLAPSPRERR